MRVLVLATAGVGLAVSPVTVALYEFLRGGRLDAVLAVFMAKGAWRISKARVLTRHASAIEVLGSASVMCTDKTGTLTENSIIILVWRWGSEVQI
jgi:Ca2+-transporting ATPase